MMQSPYFQPSFLYYDEIVSPNRDIIADCKFIQSNTSSDMPCPIPYLTYMFSNDCMDFQVQVNELDDSLISDDFSLDLEELHSIVNDDKVVDISGISDDSSMNVTSVQASLTFPMEDEERDHQEAIYGLLLAYLEAMDAKQIALAQVITKRFNEKLSLLGGSLERVLYYAFQPVLEKEMCYLKMESIKYIHEAFKAFYQIFPFGKFAHFAANSAILEALPCDAKIVHVVDFDIGNGVQWAPMIEAIGRQQRELRLSSIKWRSDQWSFEDTKRRLYDHARDFGVKLRVDEMEIHELSHGIIKSNEKKWFAFNCMASLPHMGRERSRKDIMRFLRVANEFLRFNKGVITFGDGDVRENVKPSLSFSSFLNESLVHYECLLESIEYSFPIQLKEARILMECLFVAPLVSSLACTHQKWDEREGYCNFFQSSFVMEGLKVSQESLIEAKEMVREGESLYSIRIEGEHLANNEMVLEWRNNPLVRVSCWKS